MPNANPAQHEVHETPLANRIIDDLIGEYITTHTGLAAAGYGHLTDHDKGAQEAIDAVLNLHLAGWTYALTPRIVDALKRAGLLATPAQP